MPRWTKSVEERFWEKVDRRSYSECWLWLASKYPSGYGTFYAEGKNHAAHRIAYQYEVGPIPDGMFLDHTCLNRGCVNPDHLRPVTNRQNMQNRAGAQRNSITGVRGVSWDKHRKKWVARVQNGPDVYYARFDTLEEAETAAIAKRREWHTHSEMDRSWTA